MALTAARSPGAELEFSRIPGAGGVLLTVVQAGNKDGPQILFIHGFSQSYASWQKQFADPELRRRFHLVAFDLRGHGTSGKPAEARDYTSGNWATDVAAVIESTGDRHPVLVAWSMGGAVAASYVKHRGTNDIAGLNLVSSPAVFSSIVDFPPQDRRRLAQQELMTNMQSDDILSDIVGARSFVHLLTAEALPAAEFDTALAYNLMTPAYARRAMFASYSEWSSFSDLAGALSLPVLISHGTADSLLPYQNAVNLGRAISGARVSTYRGVGHAPFLEDAARFDRELTQFTTAANASPR